MKICVIQETLMSYSDRAGFPITLCWLCFTWIDSICKGPLRNQTACRVCAMVMWPWMKSMKSMIMKLVMQSTQKMTVYCIWPSVYPLYLPPCPSLISLTFTLSLSYISYINCTFRWGHWPQVTILEKAVSTESRFFSRYQCIVCGKGWLWLF